MTSPDGVPMATVWESLLKKEQYWNQIAKNAVQQQSLLPSEPPKIKRRKCIFCKRKKARGRDTGQELGEAKGKSEHTRSPLQNM